jgi:hypothetical protein
VVLNKAATLLFDDTFVRWEESELIGHLNLAQREIATLKPASTKTRATATLALGAVQTLPTGAMRLLDVECNITSGDARSKGITYADKGALDLFDPDWMTADGAAEADNYCYDADDDATTFYVSPPVVNGTKVQILYSAYPTEITASTDALTVGDEYESPLLDYVLSRAYTKSTESADLTKASGYAQAFYTALGAKDKAEAYRRAMAERAK